MSTQVTQELGFSTYVFVERLGKNAAILHPFPEFNISLVARALEEAGLPISIMGEHAPERGEGIYFQEDPFPDEFLGILADALSVRGIGAYAYCLVDGSLGDLDLHLFTRVGGSFPRAGKKVVLMRLYLGRNAEGPAATTWIFGAPAARVCPCRVCSNRNSTPGVFGGIAGTFADHGRYFPDSGSSWF